jgi:hypothetical protein
MWDQSPGIVIRALIILHFFCFIIDELIGRPDLFGSKLSNFWRTIDALAYIPLLNFSFYFGLLFIRERAAMRISIKIWPPTRILVEMPPPVFQCSIRNVEALC